MLNIGTRIVLIWIRFQIISISIRISIICIGIRIMNKIWIHFYKILLITLEYTNFIHFEKKMLISVSKIIIVAKIWSICEIGLFIFRAKLGNNIGLDKFGVGELCSRWLSPIKYVSQYPLLTNSDWAFWKYRALERRSFWEDNFFIIKHIHHKHIFLAQVTGRRHIWSIKRTVSVILLLARHGRVQFYLAIFLFSRKLL